MYCGDKFDKAHAASCLKRKSAQVNAIVVNDLDHHLTDEVLQQLASEDIVTEEFEQLSLNAILGTSNGDVLKIQALVQGKVMLLLLDSGGTHSFVNSSFYRKLGFSHRLHLLSKSKWPMETF